MSGLTDELAQRTVLGCKKIKCRQFDIHPIIPLHKSFHLPSSRHFHRSSVRIAFTPACTPHQLYVLGMGYNVFIDTRK